MTTPNADEDAEKLDSSCVYWYESEKAQPLQKTGWQFLIKKKKKKKKKKQLPYDPHFALWPTFQRNKTTQKLYINVHRSIFMTAPN